jgi:hypothetical protein
MNDAPLFRSRTGLVLLAAAGLLLVVGLARSAAPPRPEDGPAGSSYATHGAGTAALAALLERNGYEVAQMRTPLADLPPSPDDVVVLVDGGELDAEDVAAVNTYISAGGRFVSIASSLDGIVATSPKSTIPTNAPAATLLSVGPYRTVTTVTAARVWSGAGSLLPLVGNGDGTLLGVEYRDRGAVVAIADSSIVENGELDQADNGLLALEAVGPTTGTVRFVEYVHGFTRPTGLSALPTRWKQALLLLAAAGAVWLIARGKRFGPVEEIGRSLPPPRSAYVDALALTLAAGKDPEAATVLDRSLALELHRRGVEPGSPDAIGVAVDHGAAREVAELALSAPPSEKTIRAKSVLLSHLVNKERL